MCGISSHQHSRRVRFLSEQHIGIDGVCPFPKIKDPFLGSPWNKADDIHWLCNPVRMEIPISAIV